MLDLLARVAAPAALYLGSLPSGGESLGADAAAAETALVDVVEGGLGLGAPHLHVHLDLLVALLHGHVELVLGVLQAVDLVRLGGERICLRCTSLPPHHGGLALLVEFGQLGGGGGGLQVELLGLGVQLGLGLLGGDVFRAAQPLSYARLLPRIVVAVATGGTIVFSVVTAVGVGSFLVATGASVLPALTMIAIFPVAAAGGTIVFSAVTAVGVGSFLAATGACASRRT